MYKIKLGLNALRSTERKKRKIFHNNISICCKLIAVYKYKMLNLVDVQQILDRVTAFYADVAEHRIIFPLNYLSCCVSGDTE